MFMKFQLLPELDYDWTFKSPIGAGEGQLNHLDYAIIIQISSK